MPNDFKPTIYPVMYWGLLYGLSAGVLLFLVSLFAQYITVVWFPVFLAGLIWGGYRNYQKQRHDWDTTHHTSSGFTSPLQEFKAATRDVVAASRELISQESAPQQTTTTEHHEEPASEFSPSNTQGPDNTTPIDRNLSPRPPVS